MTVYILVKDAFGKISIEDVYATYELANDARFKRQVQTDNTATNQGAVSMTEFHVVSHPVRTQPVL